MIWRYVFVMEFKLDKSVMQLHEGEDFDWILCSNVLAYELTKNTRKDFEYLLRIKSSINTSLINVNG